MKLTENYSIEFDENNAILVFSEKKTSKKKGEYISTERFYYPNLKTCLNAFVQKDLHGSTSVLNAVKRIDELETIISENFAIEFTEWCFKYDRENRHHILTTKQLLEIYKETL